MNYDQVIAFPSQRLFYAFDEEFDYQKEVFDKEHPMLSFITLNRRFRGADHVMIIAYSPNKGDFINPQRILSAMYTPKLIKL